MASSSAATPWCRICVTAAGDATSTPQIVLIPYQGRQKWVAVFGAGDKAGVNSTYGSAIYVADLEDNGKVLKRIDIPDIDNNDIDSISKQRDDLWFHLISVFKETLLLADSWNKIAPNLIEKKGE